LVLEAEKRVGNNEYTSTTIVQKKITTWEEKGELATIKVSKFGGGSVKGGDG